MSWRMKSPKLLHGLWPIQGNARDLSGHGYDMSWFGTEGYGTFHKNRLQCGTFDGSTDYLRRAEADWRLADARGTICAWAKFSAVGTTRVVWSSSDEAILYQYLALVVDVNDRVGVLHRLSLGSVNNLVTGTTVLTVDTWYHLALTSDGSLWRLYVNGIEESLIIVAGANNGRWLSTMSNRDNIVVGVLRRTTPSLYFPGDVTDVRYYSVPLTTDELLKLIHRPLPVL